MKKKILMVLDHEFPPDVRVEKQIEFLTENNYDVHIVTFTKKGAKEFEQIGNLIIHRRSISKLIHKSSVACLLFPNYFNYWNKYLADITSTYSFDVLHVHDLPLAQVGVKWSKKLSIPLILDLHENWPAMLQVAAHINTFLGKLLSWNTQWEAYERKMVNASSAIITVCEEMKERVAALSNDKEKFFVYQNVPKITPEYTSNNYSAPQDTIKLVYLGGLNKNRGVQTVIEAISLLHKDFPVSFTIIGGGQYSDDLKAYAKKLNVYDKMNFMGFLQQDLALEKAKEHHIAIIPHHRSIQTDNSSPNKLYQYMMMGLPVISSNCTSLVRVLEKYSCGTHYKDTSGKDLADKIEAMVKDPSQLSVYSKNGHTAVMHEASSDKENVKLLSVYKWLSL
jgi:glycosyltransferase involved in cell wall biosynthesis